MDFTASRMMMLYSNGDKQQGSFAYINLTDFPLLSELLSSLFLSFNSFAYK